MSRFGSSPARVSVAATVLVLLLSGVARAPADGYEPDDSAATGTVITLGVSSSHSISPAGDADWYRFTLATGASVLLETSGTAGDTIMDLYQSDGTTLIDHDDDDGTGLFSQIIWTLTAGTYTVRVAAFSSFTEINDYDLTYSTTGTGDSYEPDDTFTDPTTIGAGTSSTGHSIFPTGDQDWYRFTTAATGTVIIETSGPSGDTVMDLYQSDGTTLIASDDDGGNGTFSRISRSLSAGTYYVRVTSFSSLSSIPNYNIRLTGPSGATTPPTPAGLSPILLVLLLAVIAVVVVVVVVVALRSKSKRPPVMMPPSQMPGQPPAWQPMPPQQPGWGPPGPPAPPPGPP